MALTTAVHDSLPYIDPEPTPAERAAAQALIDADLQSSPAADDTTTHPSLPALAPSNFSPLMRLELERVSAANPAPLNAIDLSRYETSSLPPAPSSKSKTKTPDLTAHQTTLSHAYTSSTYLRQREDSMALLSQFGKNAWLIGNAQAEDVLRDLERELEARKREIDEVVIQRRAAQEGVRGEVQGLSEAWRKGVGRVLETEVAAEGVRREVLERRRAGGV